MVVYVINSNRKISQATELRILWSFNEALLFTDFGNIDRIYPESRIGRYPERPLIHLRRSMEKLL